MTTTKLTLFLVLFLATSSCTVEKRLYSKGFHVEFHKKIRESDAPDINTIQPSAEKNPANEQAMINPAPIAETSIQEEPKKENVSADMAEKMIPATQSVPVKSDTKLTSGLNRIRTGISVRIHFSESVMKNSLKNNRLKQSQKRDRDFDWGEFADWLIIVGVCVGAVFLLSLVPGVSFVEALVAILIVILIIVLFGLLLAAAFDNFEWFWSGR